ncbi:MAG: M15 family metallopeptidase [Saprospiraceae bacterium]|nr:M15 family metallopeptidase [Saprospiraceae bacterium]
MRLLSLFFLLIACANPTPKSENVVASKPPVQEPQVEVKSVSNTPITGFTLEYVMGKFDPAKHPDFTKIPTAYADEAGRYLRKDALEAFIQMYESAKKEGINLKIRSATRNFDYQKGIWERKWTGATKVSGKDLSITIPNPVERARKILEYSSMPGTSRHHWGTDIDLNNFENAYFESGQGLKEYEWLQANASTYGFCQVYSEKGPNRKEGYNLEKWHWSYLPVAKELTAFAERQLTNKDISGFLGAETASEIRVVEKYVLGINPACK